MNENTAPQKPKGSPSSFGFAYFAITGSRKHAQLVSDTPIGIRVRFKNFRFWQGQSRLWKIYILALTSALVYAFIRVIIEGRNAEARGIYYTNEIGFSIFGTQTRTSAPLGFWIGLTAFGLILAGIPLFRKWKNQRDNAHLYAIARAARAAKLKEVN